MSTFHSINTAFVSPLISLVFIVCFPRSTEFLGLVFLGGLGLFRGILSLGFSFFPRSLMNDTNITVL